MVKNQTSINSHHQPFRSLFLIGFTGAGKSTVGSLLANKINLPFWDIDTYIEKTTGVSITTLFQQGEPYFRRIESFLFKQLVTQERGVISLGGGTPLQEENQRFLRTSGSIIWLDAAPTILFQRISRNPEGQHHPILRTLFSQTRITLHTENEEQYSLFLSLYQKQLPLYQTLASVHIDTSILSPHEIVKKIGEYLMPEPLLSNVLPSTADQKIVK